LAKYQTILMVANSSHIGREPAVGDGRCRGVKHQCTSKNHENLMQVLADLKSDLCSEDRHGEPNEITGYNDKKSTQAGEVLQEEV
jgi:hypothetical protein